ncbi:MAG: biotin--[acetyl-CoA-carboxylase] ligase [Vicinamibacteria bacterium]
MHFDVVRHASVTSTMDPAVAEAARGAPEGRVVVADHQTAGCGRRGHAWASPPGAGLYLSLVLRPPPDASRGPLLSLLTLAMGVGVREGIETATGLVPSLKWPNDLLVDRRKLAGILAEGSAIGAAEQGVVVGVGINVLPATYGDGVDELATSLEGELGRAVDREALLEAVLAGMGDAYVALRSGRADDILRRWRAGAPAAEGARVEWDAGGEVHAGVTAGIDDTGALLVRTPSGIERVIAGAVRWR